MAQQKRLAVPVASLAKGGIGKVRVNLLNEFAKRGIAVDLLVARPDSPYMGALHKDIRVIRIGTSHALTGTLALAWYLLRNRPDAMLTERIRVNMVALRARQLTGASVPVFATIDTILSQQLESLRPEKKRKHLGLMRRYYPLNDGLIAVSEGVAEDAANVIGCTRERIRNIPNPIVTPSLHEQAGLPIQHPWFEHGQPPVILGVGRLEPEKDFANLLRAFAKLRRERDCRLVILGEGNLRRELSALAEKLEIGSWVDMPGFVANPYAYMARARLFALSSNWEGFGNALTEALAVGTPVVATDCPCGPREILEGGRYGALVPMGDPDALAQAMRHTLDNPPPPELLRQAAERYTVEASADKYLAYMGLA